jgi:hypothetical protein
VDLLVCCLCGGRAEILKRPRSSAPLKDTLLEAARFALSRDALVPMLGIAFLLTLFSGATALVVRGLALFDTMWALMPGAVLGAVYGLGVTCSWMTGITRRTAIEEDALESFAVSDLGRDVLRPAWLAVLGFAWFWIPAWKRVAHVGMLSAWDPVLWLLVAGLLAYAPALLLISAAGASAFDVANPLRVLVAARALGQTYLRLIPLVALLAFPAVWLLLAAWRAWVALPALGPFVLHFAALYPLGWIARTLGVVLRDYGDRLEYGDPSDYWMPVLPGAEPRGVLETSPNERA